jgi:hypothetical protein
MVRPAPGTPRAGRPQPNRRRPAVSPVPALILFGVMTLWLGAASGTGLLLALGVAAVITAAVWGIPALSRWMPALVTIYVLLAAIRVAQMLMAVHR